jgi:hypothetical protein
MECAGRGCWQAFALFPKGKGLMLKQKQIPFGNDNQKGRLDAQAKVDSLRNDNQMGGLMLKQK